MYQRDIKDEVDSALTLARRIEGVYPVLATYLGHRHGSWKRAMRESELACQALASETAQLRLDTTEQAACHRQRLCALETERQQVEQRYQEHLPALAHAAGESDLCLSPGQITAEGVQQALEKLRAFPQPPVLVPGAHGPLARIGKGGIKLLAFVGFGIPTGLTIASLFGLVSPVDLRSLMIAESAMKVATAGVVGISIEAGFMTIANQVGRLFATMYHDRPEHSLRRAVWGRVFLLLLLWGMLSVMEGFGLHIFIQENQTVYPDLFVPPLWVCALIGGVVSGTALLLSEYVGFTDSCQEIRRRQTTQSCPVPTSFAPSDSRLRQECTTLLGLQEERKRLQQDADRVKAELAAAPRNSDRLLQRVEATRLVVERERLALEAAMEEAKNHLTHLPPPMACEPVNVPAPPTHLILLPFGIRFWKEK